MPKVYDIAPRCNRCGRAMSSSTGGWWCWSCGSDDRTADYYINGQPVYTTTIASTRQEVRNA